jgi:hypothetical protein
VSGHVELTNSKNGLSDRHRFRRPAVPNNGTSCPDATTRIQSVASAVSSFFTMVGRLLDVGLLIPAAGTSSPPKPNGTTVALESLARLGETPDRRIPER